MQYKWKTVEGDFSRTWRCTLLPGELRDGVSVPSNQGQGRTSIATFIPPQQRLRHAELHIFANSSPQPCVSNSHLYGYRAPNFASSHQGIPSHSSLSRSPRPSVSSPTGELRSQAGYTAVAQPGGASRPQAATGARVSIGGGPARERPTSASVIGYLAPFPAPLAQTTRSATSSLPRANEISSQNLVGPRRNRGPSDGVLTGATSLSASERRQPAPTSTPPAALESPPLAVIDGLMTCCILLAAGRLEYREAQSEPPASSGSPLAHIDQGTSDGPQLTMNQQSGLGVLSQIGLPRHILEVQRQLYESYMAVGSTSTLPVYQATEESPPGDGFRSIESQPLPPSYSVRGGE